MDCSIHAIKENVATAIEFSEELIFQVPQFDFLKPLIKETGKIAGSKGKMLFMPLRIATTASMHGPDLPQVLVLLEKETVLERLNSIIK